MRDVIPDDLLEIQPYDDRDVPSALGRLLQSPVSERVRAAYFPHLSTEEFRAKISRLTASADFQRQVVAPAIDAMLAHTSDGFTVSGFNRNPESRKYVYVSNHRDILCDPALFTYALAKQGWDSPLICLGDNLLTAPWIIDLIKVNRGVTVKRNLTQRELLRWSHVLSELICQAVTSGRESVWIAQREGRAKDGNDLTHPGVVKMLGLSSANHGSLPEKIEALHLVPLAISYEYDPTDAMKALELHLASQPSGYQKQPGEDFRSMAMGIQGDKGRIHLEIGTEIRSAVTQARAFESRKEQVEVITAEIDRQIHLSYRLWPSNFVAFDLLHGSWNGPYSAEEKSVFVERMETQLARLGQPEAVLDPVRRCFLKMYATPVENRLRLNDSSEAIRFNADSLIQL